MATHFARGCVFHERTRVILSIPRTRQEPSLANQATDSPTSRRDFLLLAGMTTATASLIKPSTLFAVPGAAAPKSILIPAGAHPAMQSAARILAKKLKLDESAIQ